MINILIRTHDRPDKLRKCIQSIKNQTYKDWNIIISADNKHIEKSVVSLGYEYVRTDNITYKGFKKGMIRPKENTRPRKKRVYWNLYFNTLQDMAKEGYILYLDEDMILTTPNSLQLIADNSSVDELLIFKYCTPKHERNETRPSLENWNKKPHRGTISTGCFSHHTNHKARWPPQRAGDYFAVSNLYGRLKTTWLNEVITSGQDGVNITHTRRKPFKKGGKLRLQSKKTRNKLLIKKRRA